MRTEPYLDYQIFISKDYQNNPRRKYSVKKRTGNLNLSHGWLAFEYIRENKGLTLRVYLNVSPRFNLTGLNEPRHVWDDLKRGRIYLKHPVTGHEVRSLGKEAEKEISMFSKGFLYNRKTDIHDQFGGQQRGGIATPKDWPLIFLFTGSAGDQFGYGDSEEGDGTFHYFGEGQTGNMEFVRNNKATRDHAEDGKSLLLFETLGKGQPVRFKGEYGLVDWDYVDAPDQAGSLRRAIVFNLFPIDKIYKDLKDEGPASSKTLNELRNAALAASNPSQQGSKSSGVRNYYQRSKDVRDYVLSRADGACENCEKMAPFNRKDGSPYLEPHHIRKLSDGGLDHPFWVAGLCPNCHREAHSGENKSELNKNLTIKIQKKENCFGI